MSFQINGDVGIFCEAGFRGKSPPGRGRSTKGQQDTRTKGRAPPAEGTRGHATGCPARRKHQGLCNQVAPPAEEPRGPCDPIAPPAEGTGGATRCPFVLLSSGRIFGEILPPVAAGRRKDNRTPGRKVAPRPPKALGAARSNRPARRRNRGPCNPLAPLAFPRRLRYSPPP